MTTECGCGEIRTEEDPMVPTLCMRKCRGCGALYAVDRRNVDEVDQERNAAMQSDQVRAGGEFSVEPAYYSERFKTPTY